MYWFTKDDPYARTCLDAISADKDAATNLKQIRDALTVDVERGAIDFDNLTSIPDIWATHRIFDMMFFLPQNIRKSDPVLEQYREAVIRQWRAILTVLLIGRSQYKLEIVETDYSAGLILAQAGGGGRQQRFLGTIIDARPKDFIWDSETDVPFNHDTIRVYRLKGEEGSLLPIAISSTTTHIVPTPDAWKHLFGRVPWVQRTMNARGVARFTVAKDMFEKMDYVKAVALTNALESELHLPLNAIDYTKAQIYEALLADFKKDRLLTRDYFRREAMFVPELVYFSGEISTQNPDGTDPLLGGVDSCCYRIDDKPRATSKDNYGYAQYVMPITAHCRRLLASGELSYTISASSNASKLTAATVTLTRKSDGARLQMIYGESNPIVEVAGANDISTATIWPRQKIEDWTPYFAFCYDEPGEVSRVSDEASPHYTVEPDMDAKSLFSVPSIREGESYRYYAMNEFPEYWAVKRMIKGTATTVGYFRARKSVIGSPDSKNTYHAAVDFGTTSTMLYGCVNDAEPAPVPAKTLYAGAVCNPNRDERDQSISCFVPPKTRLWDIALLHSLLAEAPNKQSGQTREPLFGTWAFFRAAASDKREWLRMEGYVQHSNLKWNVSNPFDTINYLTEVLYFLALEARANGCKTLSLLASYPSAMASARQREYIKIIKDIAGEVAGKTGLTVAPVTSITESFAAANEVAEANLSMNFCTIDIGGGTSDIFLYYRRSLNKPWQGIGSSLRIGARGIFHASFWQNRGLLAQILHEQTSELSSLEQINQFEALRPAGGEMLLISELATAPIDEEALQRFIESLIEFQIDRDGKHYPVVNMLKQIVQTSGSVQIRNLRLRIAYYIGAVSYYAGMLARDRDGFEPPQVSDLTIFFAGNGSKVIEWISDDDEAVARFVKEMFRAGVGTEEEPRDVLFSERPKHEVARGAILSTRKILHIKEKNTIIAGERYSQNGIPGTAFTGMEEVVSDSLLDPEQDELKAFLSTFRASVTSLVQSGPGCLRYVFPEEYDPLSFKNKVVQRVEQMQVKKEERKPLFLIGVELIDEITRQKGQAVQ